MEEVSSLFSALYLLGRVVAVWALALALWQGAQIVRVHDVGETRQALAVMQHLGFA